MKKQKKQLFVLLILLAVVAVGCLGASLYFKYAEEKAAEEKERNTIYLTKADPLTIDSFTIIYFGEPRKFVLQGDKWVALQNPAIEIEQTLVWGMVNELATIVVDSKIEGVTDLAPYDLEEPDKIYQFMADGVEYEFYLGDFNDLSDQYYFYNPKEPSVVYNIEPGYVTGFPTDVYDLAADQD